MGATATPFELVVTTAVVPCPANTPLAPLPGAVKVTFAPATSFPLESRHRNGQGDGEVGAELCLLGGPGAGDDRICRRRPVRERKGGQFAHPADARLDGEGTGAGAGYEERARRRTRLVRLRAGGDASADEAGLGPVCGDDGEGDGRHPRRAPRRCRSTFTASGSANCCPTWADWPLPELTPTDEATPEVVFSSWKLTS